MRSCLYFEKIIEKGVLAIVCLILGGADLGYADDSTQVVYPAGSTAVLMVDPFNDFLSENKERETTNIIKLFEPYSITILTLEETKLNISKSNKDELTELINTVTPEGKLFQFDFESTINFEFWNNAHIRVKLNEIPLDSFLSNDGLSVRGSYEADKSQLYLGFYQN